MFLAKKIAEVDIDYHLKTIGDPLTKELKRTRKKERTPICEKCKKEMSFAEINMIEKYYCNECGEYIDIIREIDNSKENTVHAGNMKASVIMIITAKNPEMTDFDITNSTNRYMGVKKVKSHRSKKKLGDIAACVSFTTGENKKKIADKFDISQKYVSSGLNTMYRVYNMFTPFNFNAECDKYVSSFVEKLKYKSYDFDVNLIVKLIELTNDYNVGKDVPVRTRAAGSIWFFIKSRGFGISDKEFAVKMGMQKETFTKFYKILILTLHQLGRRDGLYQQKIIQRRNALRKFLDENKLPIPGLKKELIVISEWKKIYYIDSY